jgi:poly(A) polymerase
MTPLLDDPNVPFLLNAFRRAGHEARLVGGCVRDALMGRAIGDRDFATTATPDKTLAILNENRIKAVPTGLDHGTITAVLGGVGFEITTLRQDAATDGRHAAVIFGTDWRADAMRRDFTINALYLDAGGVIHDYTGGRDDIAAKRLRFIGDAKNRIAEDYLRILRFFRFASVFDWALDDADALAACADAAQNLRTLSRERIQHEISRLLLGNGAMRVSPTMQQHGVWRALLGRDAHLDVLKRACALEPDADSLRRLWALAGDDAVLLNLIVPSKTQKKRFATHAALCAAMPIPLEHALYYYGAEAVIDHVILDNAPWDIPSILAWEKPTFPLSAADIMSLVGGAGPRVGQALAQAERAWVASGFTQTKQSLLDVVRQGAL